MMTKNCITFVVSVLVTFHLTTYHELSMLLQTMMILVFQKRLRSMLCGRGSGASTILLACLF